MTPEEARIIFAFLAVFALRDLRDGILWYHLIGRAFDAKPQPSPGPSPAPQPVPPSPVPPVPVPDPVPPKPPVPVPVGTILTFGPGKCSWFGGPHDSGSGNAAEGLALVSSASQLPDYFLADGPGLFRRLNPDKHYIACRWDYGKTPKSWLLTHKCTVTAEKTGKSFSDVQPVDWGPNANTRRIADLSPGLLSALGITTDDLVTVTLTLEGAPPTPAPTPIKPTGLIKNVWPTQAECPQFYGDSEAAIRAQLVAVHVPWLMNGKTQTIEIHRKCADSLTRVLNYIWEYCGKSQDKIHEFEYDVFDGSFNWRLIAGTNTRSVHSYGAAVDFDAAANPIRKAGKFKQDSLIVYAFTQEGWIWLGPTFDPMHFQAARVR